MSTGGEVSEQLVRDGMIVMEEVLKIVGNLSKEGIALLVAVLKKEAEQRGGEKPVTKLKNIALQTGQTVEFFQIKQKDIPAFKKLAKEFGVQHSPAFIEKGAEPVADLIALSGDVPAVNRIFEKMGYALPERDTEKNAASRAASGQSLNERGIGSGQPERNVNEADAPPKTTMSLISKYRGAGKAGAELPPVGADAGQMVDVLGLSGDRAAIGGVLAKLGYLKEQAKNAGSRAIPSVSKTKTGPVKAKTPTGPVL